MTYILLLDTATLHRKTCKEQQSSEQRKTCKEQQSSEGDEGTEQRFVKRDAICQSQYEAWYFPVRQALLAVSRCRSLMTSQHYLRAHTRDIEGGREKKGSEKYHCKKKKVLIVVAPTSKQLKAIETACETLGNNKFLCK
jgi:hypothetical protein